MNATLKSSKARHLVATFTFAPIALLAISPLLAAHLGLIQCIILINAFALPATIGYLIYISKSAILDGRERMLWFVLIFTLQAIAMPIFWFKFLRVSREKNVST